MTALPVQFVDKMKSRLGSDYADFEKSFDNAPVKGFHCNTFYVPADGFAKLLAEDGSLSTIRVPGPDACFITESEHIGRSLLHHAGAVYSQDPSAMIPAGTVKLNGNEKVLDLCAAPGGKSSQLAMKLTGPGGLLIANEPVMSRNRILIQNMERMGYANVLVSCMQPEELALRFPSYFDVVLCDAPCSGEGMFRKYPESINEWSIENVELCAARQRDILNSAVSCLKPGGLLIYSTCTYEPAENEENVAHLLGSYPLKTEEAPSVVSEFGCCTGNGCYTFYPHRFPGEGQFVSYLRKSGSAVTAEQKKKPAAPSQELKKILSEFNESLELDPSLLYCDQKSQIHLLPESLTPISFNGFTMPGVMAFDASPKNKRIIPHHQLFKAASGCFRYRLDLSEHPDMAMAYIKGMELSLSELDISDIPNKVYVPVMYKGFSLGGGRIDRDRLKNLYPKGLRYL